MPSRFDPDGARLPIKLDATSNGEFAPVPLDAVQREANRLAQRAADDNARRRGVSRRAFMVSSCGAASALLAFNAANAAAGRTGGFFELDRVAAVDPDIAVERLEGREFVFDVQGHFVGANARGHRLGGADQFIKDVFLDSDTDMMVLSFIPSRRERELLTIQEADEVRRIVERLEGSQRLLIHGRVNPNQPGDLEDMDELAETWGVSAWKCYTQWGPDGRGFFLHDDIGLRMIEKARTLGVRNICVHKGLPFGRRSYRHGLATDIGVVARMFPDAPAAGEVPHRADQRAARPADRIWRGDAPGSGRHAPWHGGRLGAGLGASAGDGDRHASRAVGAGCPAGRGDRRDRAAIGVWHRGNAASRRIAEIPSVGALTATAVVAAMGDPAAFRSGREFAAWLGLVPRHDGTGGRVRMLGISKRGDRYLRTLLAHHRMYRPPAVKRRQQVMERRATSLPSRNSVTTRCRRSRTTY